MQLEGKVDIQRSTLEENHGPLKLAKDFLQKQGAKVPRITTFSL